VVNQQRGHQKGPTPQAGCANYTTIEEIPTGEEVLAGTFFLNKHPVIILFDSGASHDYISSTCAKKVMLSTVIVQALYVISTPGGQVVADQIVVCLRKTEIGKRSTLESPTSKQQKNRRPTQRYQQDTVAVSWRS
jgi:hypothetical protein